MLAPPVYPDILSPCRFGACSMPDGTMEIRKSVIEMHNIHQGRNELRLLYVHMYIYLWPLDDIKPYVYIQIYPTLLVSERYRFQVKKRKKTFLDHQ